MNKLNFKGNCRTTAMGIMPHKDIDKAFGLAMSMDIPFWPQLPNVSYFEDMYAQASQHFPGIIVDAENETMSFETDRFMEELTAYSEIMEKPEMFSLSEEYSLVYHRFLKENLAAFPAIRGQMIGPVSFGFKVMDENRKPIIYNEEVRSLLYDFIQRKINAQYNELKARNTNAFVWLDDPGLGWVFSGLSGYNDMHTREDYTQFMAGLDGPEALHLCANINLPYLLKLGIGVLSFDAYQIDVMPKAYAEAVAEFIRNGGIISWGIVPTDSTTLETETAGKLAERITGYWQVVADNSNVSAAEIASQALVAPARCCLKNLGLVGASDDKANAGKGETCDLSPEEQVVEQAFGILTEMSGLLKSHYGFSA